MAEPIQDGDNGFQGVNMRLDPGLLPQSFCSEAINKRFINGVAKTRPGIAVMNWSNSAEDYYKNLSYNVGDIVRYSGLKTTNGTVSLLSNPETYDGVTLDDSPVVGPISNSAVGPYFKRSGSASAQTHIPLTGVSTVNTTYWTDIGNRTFPFTNVKGVGVFRDPTGFEHLLVATATGVYKSLEGNGSYLVTSLTITNDVVFVQAFNQVLLFRGEDADPLVMADLEIGFVPVSQTDTDTTIDENDSDGTEPIPPAKTALYSGNRVWVPENDNVHVSDYLNFTRYEPVRSSLRVNQGSEDKLVALHKFDQNTLIAFKESSIYAIRNIYKNLADMSLDEMTRSYGCIAAKSVTTVGKDIWFLDRSGVRSLAVTESGKVQGVDKPVSDAIQPLIDRINWPSASKAVATYHNNRYFLAVPIDGATENNVILVYDFQTNTWAGLDEGAAIGGTLTTATDGTASTYYGVKDFAKLTYAGAKRLFFVSTKGTINLYDDYEYGGLYDQTVEVDSSLDNYGNVSQSYISDKIVTRGYSGGFTWPKNWREVICETATNNPQFTITTSHDGVEETDTLVTDKTFSRTTYDRPFGKADYVEANTNDDYLTKFRQDYSWNCDTGIVGLKLAGNGIDPDRKQTHVNHFRMFGNGRYIKITISNTRGRMEVANIGVKGIKGQHIGREDNLMGLNVTVTANESFADGATVDRAALRRAAKPTVSITGAVSAAEVGAQTIDNTKLTHMAANTVKVRDANSSGDPSDKAVANTQILIGDGTGFTAAALSGDVTMANTGAVTIAADSVEGTMLNTNAADGSTIELSSDSLSLKADSVGISHLANGTAGTLLSYDATGAAVAVAKGTAGTILTAQASGPPIFQANTGALKLLAYNQSTVDHTPASTTVSIASITLPANHGFSHVMVEADVRGMASDGGLSYSLHIGGSEVKAWPLEKDQQSGDDLDCATVKTLTFISGGNQNADTTIELFKKVNSGGSDNDYDVTFYAWRIWGLTAP